MDEGIEVLRRCFTGQRFSYSGKRYQFEDVVITPGYVQEGGPPLWIAAMSQAGAQRAARFGAHYLPQGLRADVIDPWLEAVRSDGRDPDAYRKGIIRSILVTEDRDSDWPVIRAAEQYRMALYQRFFEQSGEGLGASGERVPQTWIIGTVKECVAEICEFIREFGITDIATMAVPPGLRPEQMNTSLERLFRDVAPRVKAELGSN